MEDSQRRYCSHLEVVVSLLVIEREGRRRENELDLALQAQPRGDTRTSSAIPVEHHPLPRAVGRFRIGQERQVRRLGQYTCDGAGHFDPSYPCPF